jgi:hypothetical protein
MKARLFMALIAAFPQTGAAQVRDFVFKNNCTETVWIAGAGNPLPVFDGSPGGLALAPGASASSAVPVPWVGGRFWGRRQCLFDGTGKGPCATGDCGGLLQCQHAGAGNTSLAEFTLTGSSTGSDNYDISLVDGFDFPFSVQLNDPNPAHGVNAACQVDLRNSCPAAQQIVGTTGEVVGCKSLCSLYGTPNYCCGGPYGSPQACNNVHWDTNYRGEVVKKFCPAVYGYAFDDPSSDFNITPPPAQGYTITFCPGNGVPNSDPATTPTFAISSAEQSQTVTPGNSVVYHLTVSASNSFSGKVNLSAAHLPGSCTWSTAGKVSCTNAGTSAVFSAPSVTLTPGAAIPVTLTVNTLDVKTMTGGELMLGTGNLEVVGQSGAIENVWGGSLTVADPAASDYTLSVSTVSPQTVRPGSAVVYNLTVTPVNGFTGVVSLIAAGLPAGTGTFSVPQLSFSGSAAPQTATFMLATATSASQKTYYPLLTSFSANRLHDYQTQLTLAASSGSPDFALSLSPASTSVPAGNSASLTVSATASNGFAGAVALAASNLPAGVTAALVPANISAGATSVLTLSTVPSTPAGSYTIPVTGVSGSLSHTVNAVLVVEAGSTQLTDLDIGSPGTTGSLSVSGGTYIVSGSGSDIFNMADQFNFAYQSANGDFTIMARVASMTGTDGWAKAGVMIRASTADNASFAGVFATPLHGAAMIVRTATGVAAKDLGQAHDNVPVWVRLQRSGNTFTGSASTDGVTWSTISTEDIGASGAVFTGLAVTSKHESALNTATFTSFSAH